MIDMTFRLRLPFFLHSIQFICLGWCTYVCVCSCVTLYLFVGFLCSVRDFFWIPFGVFFRFDSWIFCFIWLSRAICIRRLYTSRRHHSTNKRARPSQAIGTISFFCLMRFGHEWNAYGISTW